MDLHERLYYTYTFRRLGVVALRMATETYTRDDDVNIIGPSIFDSIYKYKNGDAGMHPACEHKMAMQFNARTDGLVERLVRNRTIRTYLSNFSDRQWADAIKLTLLLGIQCADAYCPEGQSVLSTNQLQTVLEEQNRTLRLADALPDLEDRLAGLRDGITWNVLEDEDALTKSILASESPARTESAVKSKQPKSSKPSVRAEKSESKGNGVKAKKQPSMARREKTRVSEDRQPAAADRVADEPEPDVSIYPRWWKYLGEPESRAAGLDDAVCRSKSRERTRSRLPSGQLIHSKPHPCWEDDMVTGKYWLSATSKVDCHHSDESKSRSHSAERKRSPTPEQRPPWRGVFGKERSAPSAASTRAVFIPSVAPSRDRKSPHPRRPNTSSRPSSAAASTRGMRNSDHHASHTTSRPQTAETAPSDRMSIVDVADRAIANGGLGHGWFRIPAQSSTPSSRRLADELDDESPNSVSLRKAMKNSKKVATKSPRSEERPNTRQVTYGHGGDRDFFVEMFVPKESS